MEFQYNFENLEVWKIALELVRSINALTKKFPEDERYVLVPQIRRATLSIALNIAEGYGRQSKKDFARFISNAIGSSLEVIACLKIALNEHYIIEKEFNAVEEKARELYFKLLKLGKYLRE